MLPLVSSGRMGTERPAGDELLRPEAPIPSGPSTDEEADLYARYANRAWLYGLRHLRDREAAADLAQNALLLVIEKLRAGELRERERLGSFVLGVCRMLVRNQVRGARRRRTLLERFRLPETAEGPEEWRLDRDRLAECLQKLSERARTVTVLTYYADRSAEAIAQELALSPANVRVIRHRALQRLQECLEGER